MDAGRPVRSLLWEVVVVGLRRGAVWWGDGWAPESLRGRIPGLDTRQGLSNIC